MTTAQDYTEYPRYFVGRDCFMIRAFSYPAANEIDFEIWQDDAYLATITSNAPHRGTAVVYFYLSGIACPNITHVSKNEDYS